MARLHRVKSAQASKRTRRCFRCNHEVQPGEPYAYQDRKTGPYSSVKRIWCFQHMRSIKPSELESNPRRASIMEAEEAVGDAVDQLAEGEYSALAEALREAKSTLETIKDELEDGANNIEDGFGHETQQSEEMHDQASQLEEWMDEIEGAADEIESMEPDEPEDSDECDNCGHPRSEHGNDEGCSHTEVDAGSAEPDDDDVCECTGFTSADDDERESTWDDAKEKATEVMGQNPL